MKQGYDASPLRALLPVAIGTCLSLLGDAALYAVLPTHTADVGVTVVSVGVLLSVNRFIRLILNGPGGMAYDRWRRRRLFVPALFIGAGSTALYGLTRGFWPLFVGRLLWGLAWVGIWIGGNTIILDVARDETRGRWVGVYHISFFLGSAGGSLLGGLLTDRLGYHHAMSIHAGLTFLGAIVALIFLPETRRLPHSADVAMPTPSISALSISDARDTPPAQNIHGRTEFAAAVAIYAAQRLAVAGVLRSTLGLFLLEQLGDQVQFVGHSLGVATLTGLALGLSTLISATSAPLVGGLSDYVGNRWRVAAAGLLPAVVGFGLLATGLPTTIVVGVPLIAVTGGSTQGLSTTLIGDLSSTGQHSRRLGILFTAGDLASAVGPPLAYALVPSVGIEILYLMMTGVFAAMFLATLGTQKK